MSDFFLSIPPFLILDSTPLQSPSRLPNLITFNAGSLGGEEEVWDRVWYIGHARRGEITCICALISIGRSWLVVCDESCVISFSSFTEGLFVFCFYITNVEQRLRVWLVLND